MENTNISSLSRITLARPALGAEGPCSWGLLALQPQAYMALLPTLETNKWLSWLPAPVFVFSALAPPLARCELRGLPPFLGGVGS